MFRLLLKIALFALLSLAAAAQIPDLERLAEGGNSAAQYALGVAYVNGDGIPADAAKAAHWFEQAARRGHTEARRQLVFMRAAGLVGGTAATLNPETVFRIQVATVPSETDAEREWRRLKRRHGEALGPLEMDVVPFDTAEGSKLFRLQGGPLDEEGARAVCVRMREEGSTCLVIRP